MIRVVHIIDSDLTLDALRAMFPDFDNRNPVLGPIELIHFSREVELDARDDGDLRAPGHPTLPQAAPATRSKIISVVPLDSCLQFYREINVFLDEITIMLENKNLEGAHWNIRSLRTKLTGFSEELEAKIEGVSA